MTNANGIAAFALDGLPPIVVGTAALATASLDEASLRLLELRHRRPEQHVVANGSAARCERQRHRIPSKQGPGALVQGPVLANSRVNVTLSGLPADYDLVVFSDIQAAYNRITKGANPQQGPNLALNDLERDGAETPVDVFNTSQFNPSSWDATNWDPDAQQPRLQPDRVVANGVVAHRVERVDVLPAHRVVADGVVADGVVADGVVADGVVADGVVGEPVVADEWSSSNPADPQRSRPPRPQACSPSLRHPARVTRASP